MNLTLRVLICMSSFFSISVFSNNEERLGGFYSDLKEKKQFQKDREAQKDQFFSEKKKWDENLDKSRTQFVNEQKKSRQKKNQTHQNEAEYLEWLNQALKREGERDKAQQSYIKDKLKTQRTNKNSVSESVELGLDLSSPRVDWDKRQLSGAEKGGKSQSGSSPRPLNNRRDFLPPPVSGGEWSSPPGGDDMSGAFAPPDFFDPEGSEGSEGFVPPPLPPDSEFPFFPPGGEDPLSPPPFNPGMPP